ncbi:MAG TPA: alpha/beta hydrolase [Oculatellaceae cyanobacterium]
MLLRRIFDDLLNSDARANRISHRVGGGLYVILLSLIFSIGTNAQGRGLYDKMLFHPRKGYRAMPNAVDGVETKAISFTVPRGEHLKGWYYNLPGSNKIALISEGNGGNMIYLTHLAEILLKCNTSVMLYDYEGYGESEGNPSMRRVVDDALAAYDYMSKNLAEKRKTVLVGVSLGTGVTCQVATKRPADAIILSSPFTSLLNMAKQKSSLVHYMPTFALPRQHFDNVAVLKKKHPPVLILHGDLDSIIPISESEKLYAEASEPKTLVKLANAGHNDTFTTTHDEYQTAVQEFFDKLQ